MCIGGLTQESTYHGSWDTVGILGPHHNPGAAELLIKSLTWPLQGSFHSAISCWDTLE